MRWKVDTAKHGGSHRVIRTRLVSAKGTPDYVLENDENADIRELRDEDGRFLYSVVPNPDYDNKTRPGKENRPFIIVKDIEPMPQRRIDQKATAKVISPDNLRFLIDAVIALKNGDPSKVEELEAVVSNLESESKVFPDGRK